MWLDFQRLEQPEMHEPVMIIAVSTSMPQYRSLYSQARELGEYMLRNMKLERIATVRSSCFPPEVLVREDGLSSLPECSFYSGRAKSGPILFAGDASPMDDQHEFTEFVLGYAEELGVKEIYSVGARWADNPLSPEVEPEPNGFASDEAGVEKLKSHGVRILAEEPAPFFASMVVASATQRGIRGYKLSVDHGEPSPHVRGVVKLLEALSGLAGFEISLEELKSQYRANQERQGHQRPKDPSIYH